MVILDHDLKKSVLLVLFARCSANLVGKHRLFLISPESVPAFSFFERRPELGSKPRGRRYVYKDHLGSWAELGRTVD